MRSLLDSSRRPEKLAWVGAVPTFSAWKANPSTARARKPWTARIINHPSPANGGRHSPASTDGRYRASRLRLDVTESACGGLRLAKVRLAHRIYSMIRFA